MIPLNLRTLLKLVEAELEKLRLDYRRISRTAPTWLARDISGALTQREANSLDALRGYLADPKYCAVLDAPVRFVWAVPGIETSDLDLEPSLQELVDTAQESDSLLERLLQQLRQHGRVSGFDEARWTIEAILEGRQQRLVEAVDHLGREPVAAEPERTTWHASCVVQGHE